MTAKWFYHCYLETEM